MTDTDFLTAICANPADDTLRLIYADWLEERGQAERADWIRRWIVRDSLRCRPSFAHNMRTCPKCVETDALWGMARKEWVGGIQGEGTWITGENRFDLKEMSIVVRRGFVAELTCSAEDWLRHADALAWHPEQECPECEGTGSPHVARGAARSKFDPPCRVCNSTGKRLCPPTACPLEQVTLTTLPQTENGLRSGSARLVGRTYFHPARGLIAERDVVLVLLRAEWPGIDFKLP